MVETETRPRRLSRETETLTIFLETRPRRDVRTSRDQDVETETTTLVNDVQNATGERYFMALLYTYTLAC